VGIGKFVDGTPYKINSFGSSSQINLNTWYDLKVTVEDSEIRVYLNDELTCQVQDTSHISGKAGLTVYRSDVSFDNFGIYDVPVPIIYTLSVDSEYGTVSGSGEYESGAKAQFQVEPVSVSQGTDVRKMFYRWQGSNGFTSSSNPASVIIDEDM